MNLHRPPTADLTTLTEGGVLVHNMLPQRRPAVDSNCIVFCRLSHDEVCRWSVLDDVEWGRNALTILCLAPLLSQAASHQAHRFVKQKISTILEALHDLCPRQA